MERVVFLIILLFNFNYSNGLDYTWTESDPILTRYINENYEAIEKYAGSIFKRGENYLPYIYKMAEKYNVPKEIAAVAAIESAFNPTALSHAGASGMWQFMKPTAKDMGIASNTFDYRNDWKKSTEAAIRYLHWLAVDNFNGDYELALLAYNVGIGRIKRDMEKYETTNPWDLIAISNLPRETKEYLPKFISYVYYYHYVIQNN